ncbi:MAG: CRISPR-associated endonuclease Cas1 [Deltaproteobacteria bacterium]|nr:CRISPR-associated endonuclease Cas1 [Deltaproteobacteria bacterium]
MLNEYAYCPRLAYLEWVQNEFADNYFTEDGRFAHRRVDVEQGDVNQTTDDDAPRVVRSSMLSAPQAGFIARIDLIEVTGEVAVPVDYKRSSKPNTPNGAYDPERVQLCVQGIILRENGFTCDHGIIYFAGSKDRVEVTFDDALITQTQSLATQLRKMGEQGHIPPPLNDSPKCEGCSLVSICLPDELVLLSKQQQQQDSNEPRRLMPARDDALPVYVQEQGAYVTKSGDLLIIKKGSQKLAECKLFETSQLSLLGNIQVSTQALHELVSRNIPVGYFSSGGWFYGMTIGLPHKNIELRIHQHRVAANQKQSLLLACRFVSTKIRNCRTMLRRNADNITELILNQLKELSQQAYECESAESLLGIEGTAARLYFEIFPNMIKRNEIDGDFTFTGRNRRPPRDPVNALLSLAYSLLTKDLTIIITMAGLDPYLGFYHRPRYGRPSLALDLMEEFRPIIADSTVIAAINTGVITSEDFTYAGGAVALNKGARKSFMQAYERRMDQLIRHPVFGYQISYRRILDVQTRLLGRYLSGEINAYPEFITR